MAQLYENHYVDCMVEACMARGATNTVTRAQTLTTINEPHTLSSIVLKIFRSADEPNTGNAYVSIYTTDVNGFPLTPLVTTIVNQDDIPFDDDVDTTILFPEIILSPDTLYAIVWYAEIGPIYCRGQTGNPYPDGIHLRDDGTGWILVAGGDEDILFQIWGDPIVSHDCTDPDGYIGDPAMCGTGTVNQPHTTHLYQCTALGWHDLGPSVSCGELVPEEPNYALIVGAVALAFIFGILITRKKQ